MYIKLYVYFFDNRSYNDVCIEKIQMNFAFCQQFYVFLKKKI